MSTQRAVVWERNNKWNYTRERENFIGFMFIEIISIITTNTFVTNISRKVERLTVEGVSAALLQTSDCSQCSAAAVFNPSERERLCVWDERLLFILSYRPQFSSLSSETWRVHAFGQVGLSLVTCVYNHHTGHQFKPYTNGYSHRVCLVYMALTHAHSQRS